MNIWTIDYESLLDKIRLNSIIMSNHHKRKYYKLNGKLKWFRLPIIIISAFNSVFSVSLQQFTSQENISLINCGLSLVVGLLGSIELYLQIQKRCENELQSSKDFYLLSIDIYKMLKLNQDHRPIDGKTYLEDIYNEYCKLIENSGLVHKKLLDQLQPIEKQLLNLDSSNISNISNNDVENEIENNDENLSLNIHENQENIFQNELKKIDIEDIKYDENNINQINLSNKINDLIIKKKNKNISY